MLIVDLARKRCCALPPVFLDPNAHGNRCRPLRVKSNLHSPPLISSCIAFNEAASLAGWHSANPRLFDEKSVLRYIRKSISAL